MLPAFLFQTSHDTDTASLCQCLQTQFGRLVRDLDVEEARFRLLLVVLVEVSICRDRERAERDPAADFLFLGIPDEVALDQNGIGLFVIHLSTNN